MRKTLLRFLLNKIYSNNLCKPKINGIIKEDTTIKNMHSIAVFILTSSKIILVLYKSAVDDNSFPFT